MKLFTNKQFQRVLERELAPLKQENEELRDKIAKKEFRFLEESSKLKNDIQSFEDIVKTQKEGIYQLNSKVDELKQDIRQINGAKGGLTKYAHRLEKELAEANEKLSQRYIIKELKPEKARNTQVMKTKNSSKTSQIIKKVVEDE